MAFWEIATVALAGGLLHKALKNAREEREEKERRMNAWCGFNGDISEDDFMEMVKTAKKGIKRLKVLSADGPIVHGTVRAQSGLSEWDFKADFNDWGQITGTYWISSDNDDSSIPEHVAKTISSLIKNFPSKSYGFIDNSTVKSKRGICPYCRKMLTVEQAKFCGFCGKKLR